VQSPPICHPFSPPRITTRGQKNKIKKDTGYAACASVQTCLGLLQQVNGLKAIEERDIGKTIGLMAQTAVYKSSELPLLNAETGAKDDAPLSWDVHVFVEAVSKLVRGFIYLFIYSVSLISTEKQQKPRLNWTQVFRELDYDGLKINGPAGYDAILTAAKAAVRFVERPCFFVFFKTFENRDWARSRRRSSSSAGQTR